MQLTTAGHRVLNKLNAPMENSALQIFPVIQTLQKQRLLSQLLLQRHQTNSVETL